MFQFCNLKNPLDIMKNAFNSLYILYILLQQKPPFQQLEKNEIHEKWPIFSFRSSQFLIKK